MVAANTPRARLLVIDDERGIRELLRSELGRHGYAVDTAENGEEGLEKVRGGAYDVIISDIKMPKVDGLKLLASVKKISPETEVIMITGYATVENAVEAMKQGAYDFVQKPFNLEELTALIDKAIEKSELKALVALYESSKAIFSSLKLEKLFPVMINLLKDVVKADEVALLLLDNQNQLYLAAASFSLVYHPYKGSFITLAERLSSTSQMHEPAVFAAPLTSHALLAGIFQNADLQSIAAYPIAIENRNLGMLMAARRKAEYDFSQSDVRNLSIFVSQIAQSIANTRLYEKLEIKVSELENAHRELEQVRRQVLLAEKMNAVGEVASGISQQLAGPLEAAAARLKALRANGLPEAELRSRLGTIEGEIARCSEIVRNLTLFAFSQAGETTPTDLNRIIEETLYLVEYELRNGDIRLEKEFARGLPKVSVDPEGMKRVILSILLNAVESLAGVDAVRDRRAITVTTSSTEGQVHIEISDNGAGIEAKALDRIFDPFFTTKDPKRHLGLGLSISSAIVEGFGGKIHVRSVPGEGAAFTVNIPVRRP